MSDNPMWEIIQGDALKVLSGFAPGTFDAVITDPPYASGGRTQARESTERASPSIHAWMRRKPSASNPKRTIAREERRA